MENKSSTWETFKIWFGLGALMFGTYCGANMASGVYASQYIVPLGGGLGLAGCLLCDYVFLLHNWFKCSPGL